MPWLGWVKKDFDLRFIFGIGQGTTWDTTDYDAKGAINTLQCQETETRRSMPVLVRPAQRFLTSLASTEWKLPGEMLTVYINTDDDGDDKPQLQEAERVAGKPRQAQPRQEQPRQAQPSQAQPTRAQTRA